VAEEVLRSIDAKYGVDPALLSDADVDTLLERIGTVSSLDGRNYELLEFIDLASARRPAGTLAMLLRRVLVTDQRQRGKKGADRWLPLPYNGSGLSLSGLQQAPDYLELARAVRDTTPTAESSARHWLPTLYHAVDPSLVAGRVVFREWLSSGDPDKIIATATLLRGFDHSVVFHEHELIADIVAAAHRCGPECLENTKSELFAVAGSGVYSGTPGQPAPRHVKDRDDAMGLIDRYANNEPVRAFYAAVAAHAESSMRLDVDLWDDGDDE